MKKKFWFGIDNRANRINVLLCRIDLSVKCVTVHQEGHVEDVFLGHMVDPDKPTRDMSPEEIRLGFQELCGLLESQPQEKSKPKKAM